MASQEQSIEGEDGGWTGGANNVSNLLALYRELCGVNGGASGEAENRWGLSFSKKKREVWVILRRKNRSGRREDGGGNAGKKLRRKKRCLKKIDCVRS